MKIFGAATLVAIIISVPALRAQNSQLAGTTRTELQRHDLSTPGREMVQARVGLAPGAEAARHSHPGEEIVYVLQGSLEYRLEGSSPVTLGVGEVLFVPAGVAHSVRNVGRDNAVELATYIVEKGKPLLVPAG